MTACRQKVVFVTAHPVGEPALRGILERLAAQDGFELECAQSAEEAVALAGTMRFAVAVIAATPPESDGNKTVAAIRAHPRTADLPLLLIRSCSGQPVSPPHDEQDAVVDHFFTPVIPELLRARLGLFLDLDEKNRELSRRKAEFDEVNRRLIAAEERDRHRLAVEVHDIISSLSACHLNLELVAASCQGQVMHGLGDRIEDACAMLSDASDRLRQVCAELRPAILDYLGLLPSLRECAHLFLSGSDTALHVTSSEENERLPAEQELALFRIAREALANCARHAHARDVSIDLRRSQGHTVLTIEDNGVGFDPKLQSGDKDRGLGLTAMRERAKSAGGSLRIRSQPGAGTQIRVEF